MSDFREIETMLEFDAYTDGSGERRQRVIMVLHGHGSNKEALDKTAQFFADRIPHSLVIVPDAPLQLTFSDKDKNKIRETMPDYGLETARTWFSMNPVTLPLRLLFNRLSATHELNDMADTILSAHNLNDDHLAFFGFSQGGALALYTAFNRASPCAAVVCHSAPYPFGTPARSKPKTLVITGSKDVQAIRDIEDSADKKWFPKSSLLRLYAGMFSHEKSIRRLTAKDIPVEGVVIEEMGHEISSPSKEKSAAFIANALGVTPRL